MIAALGIYLTPVVSDSYDLQVGVGMFVSFLVGPIGMIVAVSLGIIATGSWLSGPRISRLLRIVVILHAVVITTALPSALSLLWPDAFGFAINDAYIATLALGVIAYALLVFAITNTRLLSFVAHAYAPNP